ncbi:MAG: uroporphyrinogen-III C-methyltransferase [Syntrophomonadaceae bacterium]|nr:uroporphyrinogen-III C-methyltransferase [Syntrophomonadaceae bacterium]
MAPKGLVYLIGAGPGDPGLFTIKGMKVLAQADVVVYDRLIGQEILDYARKDVEFIYVGKASSNHALPQEDINRLLVEKAREGKTVARLKGGDPFVFGRGGEEALYLREHGLDFEIVPGVTSAVAVPAYAGIPVTHRDATSSFAVITGHEKPGKEASSIQWSKIATGIGTLVFLMGVENLEFIVANLINAGRDQETPVALIRRGTFPDQEVLCGTLADIAAKVQKENFSPPAIIIVGETVNLRDELQWREKKPLWGAKILVTRARAQASGLSGRIRQEGGEAVEFPSIEIIREDDLAELHKAFKAISDYSWIIFTSVNSADIFFEELAGQGIDIRRLHGLKICAIGPATSERLTARGLIVDVIPEEYRAEGIIAKLNPMIKPGDRILLPRAQGAREILPESLRGLGAVVDEVIIYRAAPASRINPGHLQEIRNGEVDYITFTSSSTVKNFVEIVGTQYIQDFNDRVKVACIGPITARTAEEHGFSVDIIPEQYTIEALLEAISRDHQAKSREA